MVEVEAVVNDFEKYHNLVEQSLRQKYHSIPNEQLLVMEGNCLVGLNIVLIQLLGKTTEVIQSEKDSQILYRKITQLLYKSYQITGGAGILIDIFDMSSKTLESTINKLHSKLKKPNLPKSEYKHVHESLKFEENIIHLGTKVIESLRKIVKD